jgi:chromatin remodeling complex protein RSC6
MSSYHTNEEEAIPFMISAHRVSDDLAKFFNIHPGNRFLGNQIVKMLVEYIIQRQLISSENHKKVICDQPLSALLKVDSFMTHEVQTLLSSHLTIVN